MHPRALGDLVDLVPFVPQREPAKGKRNSFFQSEVPFERLSLMCATLDAAFLPFIIGGLPLGHGAGCVGKGVERMKSPAGVLSRNALALWRRGGVGFDVFFWDGKARSGSRCSTATPPLAYPSQSP